MWWARLRGSRCSCMVMCVWGSYLSGPWKPSSWVKTGSCVSLSSALTLTIPKLASLLVIDYFTKFPHFRGVFTHHEDVLTQVTHACFTCQHPKRQQARTRLKYPWLQCCPSPPHLPSPPRTASSRKKHLLLTALPKKVPALYSHGTCDNPDHMTWTAGLTTTGTHPQAKANLDS